MMWVSIILGIPHLLTGVALFCFRVSTVTQWRCSAFFQVSYCHLLLLLSIVSDIPFYFTGVALSPPRWFITTPWDSFVSFQRFHSHSSGCASSSVFHSHLLVWLCIVLGIQLSFNGVSSHYPRCSITASGVALCQFKYTTVTHWLTYCHPRCFKVVHRGGYKSYQVSHCHSQGVGDRTLCHFRCSNSHHWRGSMSFQVSYCCFLGWCCIAPSVW